MRSSTCPKQRTLSWRIGPKSRNRARRGGLKSCLSGTEIGGFGFFVFVILGVCVGVLSIRESAFFWLHFLVSLFLLGVVIAAVVVRGTCVDDGLRELCPRSLSIVN